MRYFTLAEKIQKGINNSLIIDALKEQEVKINKTIVFVKDLICTKAILDYFDGDEIEVEAENGTTQSVFGHTFGITQVLGLNAEEKEYSKFIVGTAEFAISIPEEDLIIMLNGCVKFKYNGATHYANIINWDKLMGKTLY